MSVGAQLLSEFVGTGVLVLLGDGVVATALLAKSKGLGGGWFMICVGWGIGVFAGVTVATASGGVINPAVVVGQLVAGEFKGGFGLALLYIVAEVAGAFLGGILVWLAFKQHFDAEPDPAKKLGVFATGPEIRSIGWNLVTEVIATFVLVFVIIGFSKAHTPASLGALPVALLVVGIGISLGGPTGWAINPARDFGPRLAHAVLPIDGGNDWSYSWVPVVGPLIGGALGGALSYVLLPVLP